MKAICYGVWGNNPMYTIGAIRNVDIAKDLFPDWTCIVYCFESVSSEIVKQLKSRDNVIVRMATGIGNRRNAVQRFFPAEEDGVEYMISRDTDSRLSPREVLAVEDWISKGADVHIMRDHPYHGVPIPAGMWGVRGGRLKGIQKYAEELVLKMDENYKYQDQDFLSSWVWSKIINGELTVCIHDPFFQRSAFPEGAKRGDENRGVWFVGQIFDENDVYNSQSDADMVKGTK